MNLFAEYKPILPAFRKAAYTPSQQRYADRPLGGSAPIGHRPSAELNGLKQCFDDEKAIMDPRHKLTVILNGDPSVVLADNLAALVADNGYDGTRVATALNGVFVPVDQRATTTLRPGDRIEILSARQGG